MMYVHLIFVQKFQTTKILVCLKHADFLNSEYVCIIRRCWLNSVAPKQHYDKTDDISGVRYFFMH